MNPYIIRIIIVDSYMSAPVQGLDVMYSEFRGSVINHIPIVRLFGATETGQKICLHIHGVFPYLYIPYDGCEDVNSLMHQLAINIDKAINVSLNQASSNAQHVYKISLVSGIPMYGYHSRNHQFLKIQLYNPLLIRRLSDILMNEATFGKLYQPHETHVPFTLQFMIDYNLHGMSNLVLSKMKFRVDPKEVALNATPELTLPATIKKLSVCEIEGDALAEHILNRLEIASGNIGVNPGIAALWADEMQRRRNKGETSQIEHLLELTNTDVEPTKSHVIFKQALLERLAVTSTENDVVCGNLNLSVYPAETPENMNIHNASLVDSQGVSDLELSLDETLTSANINTTTISGQLSNLSETMNEEDRVLLQILQNLEANAKENVEEDSILSQVLKDAEEDKDLDLSMPLEAAMTPEKIISDKEDADEDDLLNTTLIPQLDGEWDDETEVIFKGDNINNASYHRQFVENNFCGTRRSFSKLMRGIPKKRGTKKGQKFIKKALYVILTRINVERKGRDMPLLDDNFYLEQAANVTINTKNNLNSTENTDECKEDAYIVNKIEDNKSKIPKQTRTRKTRKVKSEHELKRLMENKTAAELKSWEFQIKTFKRREVLIKTMKKLHRKEHKICLLVSKNCKPMFNVVPGNNYPKRVSRPVSSKETKIDIIAEIMLKTRNYIDPNLHLTVLYPSKETFLYVYNKNMYPKVTNVPNEFTKIGKEQVLKNLINDATEVNNNDYNNENNEEDEIKISTLKPAIEVDCSTRQEENLNKSLEFLINNNTNSLYNILQEKHTNCMENSSCNSQNNQIKDELQNHKQLKQIHFPQEIIDSDNTKNLYIFSSKYLNLVYDDNLVDSIKNQSIDQTRETLKLLKIELEKHIANLKKPICYDITGGSGNNCDNSVKGENKISNSYQQECLTVNNSSTHKDCVDLLKSTTDYKTKYVNEDTNKNTKSVQQKHVRKRRRSSVSYAKNNLCLHCNAKHGNHKKDINIYSKLNNNNLKICDPVVELQKLQNIFLDGTVDSSSSSEDESRTSTCKKYLKKESTANLSQYPALPVTFASSSHGSDTHLVSQNKIKNFKEKEASINNPKTQKTDCDIVKRRLDFENTSLQTTIIEEKLLCSYSPSRKPELTCDTPKKIDKSIHHKNINSSNRIKSNNIKNHTEICPCDDKCTEEVIEVKSNFAHDDNSNNTDCENKSEDNSTSISLNSNSTCCDIFSGCDSEDEMNRSFFRSPQIANRLNLLLTTAQKYDKEVNYNAKEGTSKVFTPQSCANTQKTSGENHSSSGSSSFGLLTPYQHVEEQAAQLNIILESENESDKSKNEKLHSNRLSHMINVNKGELLTPSKKAPTREQVFQSLNKYNIPYVKENLPFYSNIDDFTGSVEVGCNVLKIPSNTSAHLVEFESLCDSINSFRKYKMESVSSNLEWRRSNVNNLALSFCKDRVCVITPIKKPPSVVTVKNWISEKSKKKLTPEKKTERIKIFIPLSPGNNDNDEEEMDISLTVSPCSPNNSHASNRSTCNQTPKSSKTSGDTSPVLNRQCRSRTKKLKQKMSQRTPSLRKSLLISQDKSSSNNSCQITGVSPNSTYTFNHSIENLQAARALVEHQQLTVLVMELHIRTRGDYKPHPEYDSIRAIFYSVLNDVPANHPRAPKCKGVIAINSLPLSPNDCKVPILDGTGINCKVTYVDSEENLIKEFLKLIEYWNPDIFAGYEIQMLSWGYLIDRASVLGMNLKSLLSRIKEDKKYKNDDMGQNELQISGRIILDVWRLMRHEIALQSYTFESVTYHILHKRVPHYSFKHLSFWWDHRSTLYRYRTVHYYLFRIETILELFDKLDVIGRTSELARLFGIQFFEVLSRGSQFRVESMMLRLAKPLNFIPVSPSVQQRAFMKAPEYIPLVLEPESKLYNDPVIVLDFQSLYPSIIIAYNYCFTTCLGRVEGLGKNVPFEFGATQLKVSRKRLEKLLKKDLLNFSPCGVGFVKKKVRDGILPRMLREILDTRLMVKNSMKENKEDKLLQKVLHNRQLGLKLIANVTYGYTAANFSGRMPSVEVGDSVVSKGRETLQRAIEMVDNTSEWGARVVYGDTDSLFVLVPGRTRQDAFEVGKKIADAITKANPDPIKLKLEKVYQPCILQTKKRYVGYMYETPDQKDPVYDAKGIETVRRDGCPAVSKMLEKCLRLLFETKDVSLVKKYVLRQFNKIIAGRASIQDLTFAKEYRGASGYRPGACVPSLELARKWTAVDSRNEPRRGERVPYIIVNGPPGLPLIRLVRSPKDLLNDPSLRPNALYYITKVIIPAINRCFNLIGADLNTWFNQMPRKQIQTIPSSVSPGKKSTISQYFSTTSCVVCGEQTQTGICTVCIAKPQVTCITLVEKLRVWERNNSNCNLICQTCSGIQTEFKCVSLDCPVLYRRIQTNRDLQQAASLRELMSSNEFLF